MAEDRPSLLAVLGNIVSSRSIITIAIALGASVVSLVSLGSNVVSESINANLTVNVTARAPVVEWDYTPLKGSVRLGFMEVISGLLDKAGHKPPAAAVSPHPFTIDLPDGAASSGARFDPVTRKILTSETALLGGSVDIPPGTHVRVSATGDCGFVIRFSPSGADSTTLVFTGATPATPDDDQQTFPFQIPAKGHLDYRIDFKAGPGQAAGTCSSDLVNNLKVFDAAHLQIGDLKPIRRDQTIADESISGGEMIAYNKSLLFNSRAVVDSAELHPGDTIHVLPKYAAPAQAFGTLRLLPGDNTIETVVAALDANVNVKSNAEDYNFTPSAWKTLISEPAVQALAAAFALFAGLAGFILRPRTRT